MNDLFYRYNMSYDPKDIDEWNTLEDMLAVFCRLDENEIYEEAISEAETDDERAGYFDSPAWNVGYYTKYIDILKQEFNNWISEIDVYINHDSYFIPSKEDFILTFNYTETIEVNYSLKKSNILHIHGKIGENLIVGHNDYQKLGLYNIVWDEDSDYRSTKAMEEVDNVLLSAAKLYYKDSETILEHNKLFIEQINRCDKVVFLGLSCGAQDYIYVKEIVQHAKNIDFIWYDRSTRENFKKICGNENPEVQINFIEW